MCRYTTILPRTTPYVKRGPFSTVEAANVAYAAVESMECVTGNPALAPNLDPTGNEESNALGTAAAVAAAVAFVALSAAGWEGCASTETGTAAAELVERNDAMEVAVEEAAVSGSQGEVAVDLVTAW